jgi:CRISPR-associated endonuclease/helicase Cas3
MEIGNTYVFKLDKPLPIGFIRNANDARLAIKSGNSIDWFAPETMTEYFRQLYSRCNDFDKSDIKTKLYKVTEMQFETADKEFNLIEDNGVSVIINYGSSSKLIETLKCFGPSYGLRKKLSRYSVSINHSDFDDLRKFGIIEELLPGIFYISDASQYDEHTGLSVKNHWLNEIQII